MSNESENTNENNNCFSSRTWFNGQFQFKTHKELDATSNNQKEFDLSLASKRKDFSQATV